ncbi:MAG: phage head-tail connector protein [Erysipelotrichaceae bacterium]|nr:phage head-tail connector protein [Erysipelotrichaceae bacterium]
MTEVSERIKNRLKGETYDSTIMEELMQTIKDRLTIRLGIGSDTFPEAFNSILVDATVKAWRRRYYEGISSENNENLSDSFVDDILSEYEDEIQMYRNTNSGSGKVVRFL